MPSKREGIPRVSRIRKRADFQEVYRKGVRVAGRYLLLFALPRESEVDAHSRRGVTATRKVGGAVVRARCKRRLRELYRLRFREFDDNPIDVVLHARSGCDRAPWRVLEKEFDRCLRKARSRLVGLS
ncbi:MAG: ribonuclease P protein component [bacterium]|nr:ribonuclease P protein component [bacterium]